MKSLRALSLFAMSLLLPACSSSYDCSSGDVTDVLGQKAKEYIVKADEAFQKTWGVAVTESVNYEFNTIRTLAHDESTDSYQCSANFKTSTADGKTWEQELEYNVYPIDDPDSDFQVEYDSTRLLVLMMSALGSRDLKLSEPMRREREKASLLSELNRYRTGGDWSGEKSVADALVEMGEVIPQRTPAQQVMFGPAPLDFYGRPMEVPGGELQPTPELLELQAQKKDEAAKQQAAEAGMEVERAATLEAQQRAWQEEQNARDREAAAAAEEQRRKVEAAEAMLRSSKGYGSSIQQ